MVRLRSIAALATLVMGLLGVAGCSSGASSETSADSARSESAAGSAGSESAAGNTGGPRQPAAAAPAEATGAPAQARHVVHTATLHVRVDDVDDAAAQARGVAERFGGYVADESSESDTANLTLRVATDRLGEALATLDGLGEVTHREQQAKDVTEQVVDVETRITNQRASVERIRVLLDRATTVGEVVQIESELTKRQAELESLENRAAALAGQAELATVTVRLAGGGSTAIEDERTGFLAGLESGWNAFVASVTALLTVLGAILPFLLALGIPALFTMLTIRRRRAAERPASPQPPPSTSG